MSSNGENHIMIEIREELPQDKSAVHTIHVQAFPSPAEAHLVDLLRTNGKALISYVAVDKDLVVGHVLYSPVSVETSKVSIKGLGLAPVAVLPAYQRKGIGSQLIRASLDRAQCEGFGYVVVLGDPHYYGRFGFQAALNSSLENEYGVNEEFMVLELIPDTIMNISGLVKYSPEFKELNV